MTTVSGGVRPTAERSADWLDAEAAERDRSKAWIVNEALRAARGEPSTYDVNTDHVNTSYAGFAELERAGFQADELYQKSELGEYQATVRMFDHGYLTRVIHDRRGVWVTTDSMSMERFEELASSVKPILAAHTSDIEVRNFYETKGVRFPSVNRGTTVRYLHR